MNCFIGLKRIPLGDVLHSSRLVTPAVVTYLELRERCALSDSDSSWRPAGLADWCLLCSTRSAWALVAVVLTRPVLTRFSLRSGILCAPVRGRGRGQGQRMPRDASAYPFNCQNPGQSKNILSQPEVSRRL